MAVAIYPITPGFAAEIGDVDLSRPLSPDDVTTIKDALWKYAVLVFPAQVLTADQHIEFAKFFGPLEVARQIGRTGENNTRMRAELADPSNLDYNNEISAKNSRLRMTQLANRLWHTDSSFRHVPAQASLLYSRAIAPIGGHTEFADMRAGYDALPADTRGRIDDLLVEHWFMTSRAKVGFHDFTEEERADLPPVQQRLVRTIAETGRRSLYLASHAERVLGTTDNESRRLLEELTAHATQRQFVYTHRWRANDLVIWDNRCTMHRGTDFDDLRWKRDLQRATVSDAGNTCDLEPLAAVAPRRPAGAVRSGPGPDTSAHPNELGQGAPREETTAVKNHASMALSGLRVLDLSRARAGPTCVRVLADFGADVVRIEAPRGIDDNEAMIGADRIGSDFQNLNRNKRSLTLNLKKPEGLAVFMRLVEKADVVVENWRPDVKKRLGVDYESLRKVNPRIILASISGFGQDGPYARRAGFDQVIQGMGGLMSVTGFPGQGPVRTGLAIADSSTGLYAAIGVLTALFERKTSGEGQWVHTSLLHALIAMMDFQAVRYLNEGEIPVQIGNDHPTAAPMGTYEAADGAHNIGVSGHGMWKRFCEAVGKPEWASDPEFASEKLRVKHRARLNRELQVLFQTNTVAHWVEVLNQAGVPSGPVYTVPEMFEDPQVRHLGPTRVLAGTHGETVQLLTQPIRLERTPAEIKTLAPEWGEHTDEVLDEAGYSRNEIDALRAQGVV